MYTNINIFYLIFYSICAAQFLNVVNKQNICLTNFLTKEMQFIELLTKN